VTQHTSPRSRTCHHLPIVSLPGTATVDPLSVYSIGLKLRTLRTAKHLTLSRLAAQTRLSTALLSKLETDHMIPTLQTLERICRVFGISLGHFFCEPQHHSVSITRREHQVEPREHHSARQIPLSIPTCQALLDSQILALPAGASITTGECGSVTETTAYVLEGTLHISAAGTSEALEIGDSIVITSDQPVIWSAEGKSPCRFLSVSAKHSAG
jgi:transcriptional regulator with XRE-family HTH domain